MSEFVEECRREWRRLRVPDQVAEDMAAELAADLEDAAAEGVSPETLLGRAASDPRSFATSWAVERGVIEPRATKRGSKAPLALGVVAVLAATAAIAAGVALLASPGRPSVALPAPSKLAGLRQPIWLPAPTNAAGSPRPRLRIFHWYASGSAGNQDTTGWILLSAGVVAVALSSLYWWKVGRRYRQDSSLQPPKA